MTDHRPQPSLRLRTGRHVSDVVAPVVLLRQVRRYPAEAPTRHFVGARVAHSRAHKQSPLTRFVAGVLIPLLLVSPHARVYADEVATVDAEVTSAEVVAEPIVEPTSETPVTTAPPETVGEVTPETGAVDESAENVEVPSGGDGTTPTEVIEVLPVETAQTDTTPISEEVEVVADEVPTENDPLPEVVTEVPTETDAPPTPIAEESPAPPLDGATTTSTSTPADEGSEDIGTSTPPETLNEAEVVTPVDATSTNAVEEESQSDAPDATSTEEVAETFLEGEEVLEEEIIAPTAVLDERAIEERLRDRLRKEVEEEFTRGCITFESSGYYCLKGEELSGIGAQTAPASAVLESVQEDGGDKEIAIVRLGERIVLTRNDFDDAFPSMDITGTRFVWQGMKSGRWQIFTTHFRATGTPEILQVTDGRESNFNPKIDGDNIVWQGWVNENWEIFMATRRDADSPLASEHLPPANALVGVGSDWSVERLTENAHPDMFPSLHGNIVTWQSREGDNWIVYAYSISAKTKTRLSSDDVKSENPRFSITWEESDGEGTSRLVGYDISTGEKVDLTERARAIPAREFPRPSPTPVSSPDQATIPPVQSGTSTPQREGDEPTGDDMPLP